MVANKIKVLVYKVFTPFYKVITIYNQPPLRCSNFEYFSADISERLTQVSLLTSIVLALGILALRESQSEFNLVTAISGCFAIIMAEGNYGLWYNKILKDNLRHVWDSIREQGKEEAIRNSHKRYRVSYVFKILSANHEITEKAKYFIFDETNQSGFAIELGTNAGSLLGVSKSDLNEVCQRMKKKARIRYSIHLIPEKFWKGLAGQSVRSALGISDQVRLDEGMPEHDLASDIYICLSAWLVCSIDNDAGRLMPVDYIGLKYKNDDESCVVRHYMESIGHARKVLLDYEKRKEIWQKDKFWKDEHRIDEDIIPDLVKEIDEKLVKLEELLLDKLKDVA